MVNYLINQLVDEFEWLGYCY